MAASPRSRGGAATPPTLTLPDLPLPRLHAAQLSAPRLQPAAFMSDAPAPPPPDAASALPHMQLPASPPPGTPMAPASPDVVIIMCAGLQHRATTFASALAAVRLRSIVIENDQALTHHPLSITDPAVLAGLGQWIALRYIAFTVLMSPCGTHSVNHHPTPAVRVLRPHPVIPRFRYPVAARLGVRGLPPAMRSAVEASNMVVEAAIGVVRAARRASRAGFIVESAIDRGDPGTTASPNPHFRPWYALHAPLWLTPPLIALADDTLAQLREAPQCAFGALFQKWTAFLSDPTTAGFLSFLSSLECCGVSPHPRRARGWAADGSSLSAPAGCFPDTLYHALAQSVRQSVDAAHPAPPPPTTAPCRTPPAPKPEAADTCAIHTHDATPCVPQ